MIPGSRHASRVLVLFVLGAIVAGCAGQTASPTSGSPTPSSATPASATASPTPSQTPSPTAPTPSFDPDAITIAMEPVVDGFSSPLAVVNAGDGSGRLIVAEQGGAIGIVRDGAMVERPFLDISDRISTGAERGLLGLAFHPDFPADPRVFVDYTDTDGNTRVSSFKVDSTDPDRADPASEVRMVFIKQPFGNHNGGVIAFGPDGFLYIGTGDGGSGGDPFGNGQSLGTLLGKILRIDVDGTNGDRNYAIPADNPFAGRAGAQPEIFTYGMRNPWRMSFDRATGDLWIGDVGQGAWEEIDVVRAGTSGQNFGWNRMEGAHCFEPSEGCEDPSFVLPVTEYGRDLGSTVIGGDVYRGSEQAGLAGGYVFADFGSGNVFVIDAAVEAPTKPILALASGASISSFGEDEAGELYATDLSSGRLLHVTAKSR
jgi:glucose/arabinose dehydrogenase